MRICRPQILGAGAAFLLALLGLPAVAYGWTAPNPSSNIPLGTLPDSCWSDPTGTECTNAGISYLDQARASMNQPVYGLPGNFDSLSQPEQAFVLTNLDRVLYGLPPVPGLTGALNQDAAAGVQSDDDPVPSDNNYWSFDSNWAGGYPNMVLAYGGWMYDDGQNSGNLDCTPSNSSGCWGHRQDILWKFDSGGALAMGAAVGTDPGGSPGQAMLLEQGAPGWTPSYVYTWSQALADGAKATTLPGFQGSGSGSSHKGGNGGSHKGGNASAAAAGGPGGLRIDSVRVRGRQLTMTISGSRAGQSCLLRRLGRHGWFTMRTIRCSRKATFSHLPAGRYRVRVKSSSGTQTRRAFVR